MSPLPEIGPFTYGFVNLGRNKKRPEVVKAMAMIRRELNNSGAPWMMNFVEMDEGDKGYSDRALLRRVFPKARKVGMRYKNVVLVGGGAKVVATIMRSGSKGVARWSPGRNVVGALVQIRVGEEVADYSIHMPAGAYNGQRPLVARRLLRAAYGVILQVFRNTLEEHNRQGIPQVYGIDANARKWPKQHRGETVIMDESPDFLRALAPEGYAVVVHKTWKKETGIEAHHDAMFATVSFLPIAQKP